MRAGDKRALDWSVEHGLHHSMHRTEALLEISKGIPVVWALTGTPILSRPVQLFNILRLIRHPLSRSFSKYAEQPLGFRLEQPARETASDARRSTINRPRRS